MRLDLGFAEADRLGVQIEWVDLGATRRGEYLDDLQLIRLSSRLVGRDVASVLAHELGHAWHRDRVTNRLTERRAWEYAAVLLVTTEEYATAERIVGHHRAALAIELDVTPEVVAAWRRVHVHRRPQVLTA